ncbi:hypothetical protein [Ornithinibacillus xuwenensis]|uniref:Uncharacterized protein n=1 Tax=Ornithinibacillus xuwenensis TaxID=3144668 RepID=A0ABU9XIQ9_9BACI
MGRRGENKQTIWEKVQDSYSDEVVENLNQLGKYKDLKREEHISELIKRPDTVKFAEDILVQLSSVIKRSNKLTENAKEVQLDSITSLSNQLCKDLSPMEMRYIYTEIATIRRTADSMGKYRLMRFKRILRNRKK